MKRSKYVQLSLAASVAMAISGEAAAVDQPRNFQSVEQCVDAEVAADVHTRAQRIARLAPQAARLNKQTVRALHAHHEPMDAVLAGAYRYASSAEHREGIEAFLAKRQPVF